MILCLTISCAFASAYGQVSVPIWPGLAPGTNGEKNNERMVNGRIYDVYQPSLTVYLPVESNQNHPAVLVCPGGGYTHLAIVLEVSDVAGWLNQNGIAAFVLKYRLNPDRAMDDAERAISFIRASARHYSINPRLVGIMGFSAGGQVAAGVATHCAAVATQNLIDSNSCKPDFMVLVYPALDWLHTNAEAEHSQSSGRGDGFVPFYRLVNAGIPPVFIVHAADDETVPVTQSVKFFSALHKAGVQGELHVFEKGGHGFGLGNGRGEVEQWPELCITWLRVEGILSGR